MPYSVTYEIVTQESAEHGDAAERGYISEDVSFREAIEDVRATRTAQCDGRHAIEPNASHGPCRWIAVVNGMEFLTGANETRSIHFPDTVTQSSARRIARLIAQA